MFKPLLAMALTAALTQFAFGQQPGIPENASSGTGVGAFGAGEPFFPFDAYEPWVHGHFQRIPAYGGYHYFRPYNYRHVMPQSQVGAGWGMPATMPYSQGFYRSREQQYGQQYGPMGGTYPRFGQSERPFYSRYGNPQPQGVIPTANQQWSEYGAPVSY